MSKTIILSNDAPKPVGPYNQAVRTGNLVFCAGQIALDPATGKFSAFDITGQTNQIMKNIAAVLSEAGCKMEDIVKATVFLKDMNDFTRMNEAYSAYFNNETAPARSTVQVARLPLDALVEIEVVAQTT